MLQSLEATLLDNPGLVMGVLVFVAVTALAFGGMAAMRVRAEVKRRAAGVAVGAGGAGNNRSLRHASFSAAQRLVEYTSKHYASTDESGMKKLRREMIQAGFLDARAPALFFLVRGGLAILLAAACFVWSPYVVPGDTNLQWVIVWGGGIIGYLAPTFYLGRRIKGLQDQHRAGFPDFMDLLVVCADAGLSMEAALDRVGRELHDTYPSLSANIYMATLEIRAGKRLAEALEHLGDRLGLDEARSFATLLQQSEELGSSLTEALRVYSDDMRHKRLSRAEEKAYSLPAKLSVPLTLCVFPIIVIIIMLPVFVRFKVGT